ncbi:hypothetical protein P3W45_001547 [Vairimorpha bombi]
MDRIDKFLNRRKQKTKKTLKTNNKYYEITKEDIKIVRQYKKNACLDPTVDMYIPYKLKFTKSVVDTPLDFIRNSLSTTAKDKQDKKNKKFVEKNDYIKHVSVDRNIIRDVWDDNLEDYDQNIVLDITEQYSGKLNDLKMDKGNLEKELRKAYLRQYLPREKKVLKISDIVKNNTIDRESLKPYPEMLSKYYDVEGSSVLSSSLKMMCAYRNNLINIYEIRKFYKIANFEMSGDILSVKFTDDFNLYVLCKDKEDSILYNIRLTDDIPSINKFSDINNGIDFDIDKYNLCITSKSVKMIGTNSVLNIPKIDKLISVRTLDDLVFVTTTNSIKVYDLSKKILMNDSKIFSYIVDFIIHKNFIFLINNLRKIIIFDYERNTVIHSMLQESDVLSITYNEIYSLLAVSTTKEILIFYINIGSNQYILVNKIQGGHNKIKFDTRMPWLYGRLNNKIVMYT